MKTEQAYKRLEAENRRLRAHLSATVLDFTRIELRASELGKRAAERVLAISTLLDKNAKPNDVDG